MNTHHIVLLAALLSLNLTNATDLCEPCVNTNPNRSTRREIHRFSRMLGNFRHYVNTTLTYFVNEHSIEENTLEMYINWPPVNPFRADNEIIDDLMAAYGSLTDADARLRIFNDLRRVSTGYDTEQIKTPLCHLWKAVTRSGAEVPCTVCRKDSTTSVRASDFSQTNAISYVYITLHRTLHLIDTIREHFRII